MGGVVPRVGGDDEKDSSMAELPPSDLFGVENPARINNLFLSYFRQISRDPKEFIPACLSKENFEHSFYIRKIHENKLKALYYLYYITYHLNFLMTLLRLKLNSILHSSSLLHFPGDFEIISPAFLEPAKTIFQP